MNLKNYTTEQLAKMMRGKLLQKGQSVFIEHLLLDSRKLTIAESTVFFGIKGDRRNGHQFIGELYKKGVRCFVVSETIETKTLDKEGVILEMRKIEDSHVMIQTIQEPLYLPV